MRARCGPRRAWIPRLQPHLPLPQTCACHSPPNRLQQPEQWARAPALHAALALASRWGAFWTGAGGGLGQRERGFHFLTRRAPNPDALCGRERARGHEEAGQSQTFRKELNLEPAVRPGPGRPGRQAPPARSHRRWGRDNTDQGRERGRGPGSPQAEKQRQDSVSAPERETKPGALGARPPPPPRQLQLTAPAWRPRSCGTRRAGCSVSGPRGLERPPLPLPAGESPRA